MRFAASESMLDCQLVAQGPPASRADALKALVARAAQVIHTAGFVNFRLGRLRLGAADSRELARAVAAALRDELVARGAPPELRLEQDRAQQTYVPEGHVTRTLLPHHDGQHCSYLTPSTLDHPGWLPQWRAFGKSGYTTTPAHKMYQGVFITDPGEGLSVTTYYDWLDQLATVYADRNGRDPGRVPPAELAGWLGSNLRTALGLQATHGCPYPSLGAMLGVGEPMWHGLSFHHAEAPLTEQDRSRYPAAVPLAKACPCGDCVGEVAALFCHLMLAATGRKWRECRRRWEVLAPSERFDFVFGHNLTMLHGGLAGGRGRVIEPFCLVVDDPQGPDYERWLAASWRRQLPTEVL